MSQVVSTPGQALDLFLKEKRPRTEFEIDFYPERLKGSGNLWELTVYPDPDRGAAKWEYGAKSLGECVHQALRWEKA